MTPVSQAELDFLRGPFDADRMIRLDHLPRSVADAFGSAYAASQQRFPSVDRNSVYLTWSLGAEDEPVSPVAVDNRYGVRAPLIVIGGEYFATTDRATTTLAWVKERDAVDPGLTYAPPPDRSLEGYAAYVTDHEHGHTLLTELIEAHGAATVIGKFVPTIAKFVPGYTTGTHNAHGEALSRQGVMRQEQLNFLELVPELFAMNNNRRQTELSAAVGGVFAQLYVPHERAAREQKLLVPGSALFDDASIRVPDVGSGRQTDERLLQVLAAENARTGEAFGPATDLRQISSALKQAKQLTDKSDALDGR